MPSDTIPEHALDLDSEPPPPPRREPTGRHRAALSDDLDDRISHAVERAISKRAPSQTKAIIALVLAALSGSGGTYVTQRVANAQHEAAAETRAEERFAAQERRLDQLERQTEGIGALSRDIAALAAKVDGITATNAATSAALVQRLGSIEDRINDVARRR